MFNDRQLRIVLMCDNKNRELDYLLLLQKELQSRLHAKVHIIGSIAEIQRTYVLLYKMQPHLVIMSQIFEKSCRQMADYIRTSGAQVAIIPCELRVTQAFQYLVTNEHITFSDHCDYYFLPGRVMESAFAVSDLAEHKMFVTGSPKMDVPVLGRSARDSRTNFLSRNSIPAKSANIFIFTSFVTANEQYLQQDALYANQMPFKRRFNQAVQESQQQYMKDIVQLANAFPKVNFIWKPHPLETTQYQDLLARAQHRNLFFVQAPITDCFSSIDLAIHWMSTVALECWIESIPTLQYFPETAYTDLLPDFSQANPLATTYEQLQQLLQKFITSPNSFKIQQAQQDILTANFYKLDGKSTKRIAYILNRMVPKQWQLSYKPNFTVSGALLFVLEATLGVRLSRRLLQTVFPAYQGSYAISNYVNKS